AAEERRIVDEDRMPARNRAHDDRHRRVVAIADAHRLPVLEVDAVQAFDERRDEMAARLLAVAHDVDAGSLLVSDDEAHSVALAFGERIAFELPRRPKRLGLR